MRPLVFALTLASCAPTPTALFDGGGADTSTGDAGSDLGDAVPIDAPADDAGDAGSPEDAVDERVPVVDGTALRRIYESCALDAGEECGPGLACLPLPVADAGTRGVCSVGCDDYALCPGFGGRSREVCFVAITPGPRGRNVCVMNCGLGDGGADPPRCPQGTRCVRYFESGTSGVACLP